MINGFINVYKERGWTSRDAVSKLGGILHQRRIGHTGTLDPEAEGVLPMALGNATKAAALVTDKVKEYEAILQLGVTTDTEDMTGEVLSEVPADEELFDGKLEELLKGFTGPQLQVPPMYSAKRVGGKHLYELARKGEVIEREACPIEIFALDLLWTDKEKKQAGLRIRCSKGTYIRSLCRDIGEKAGCGGAMAALLRTETGIFRIGGAKKLSEIEEIAKKGELSSILLPTDAIFADCEALTVSGHGEVLLANGGPLSLEALGLAGREINGGTRFRMYGNKGFMALYEKKSGRDVLTPVKMFVQA